MIQYNNFLMKREQSRAGSRFAECEKSRLKAKILITLALLLTAVTGAWATDEQSESFTTTNGVSVYTGEHFKITASLGCDGDGIILRSMYTSGTATIEALNGENITKIEMHMKKGGWLSTSTTTTAGKLVATDSNSEENDISVTDINATSVTIGTSYDDDDWIQINKFVIYYTAAEAPITVEPVEGKTNEWTFKMPGSDVVLTPQYAPAAQWAKVDNVDQLPTAIEGIYAGTTDAIVNAGAAATGQGTVMYAVTSTNQATAPELSAFSATLPTAENIADEGADVLIWYYIKGADTPDGQEATAENTFNDSEICTTPLQVTVLTNKFDITLNAANANTIEAGKATVTVGGTDKTSAVTEGKLEGVKMGSEVKLEAKPGYKFRKVEVKKAEAKLPKYADVVKICDKNADNQYLISSFFDGTNANFTTITKEEAIALAEYLGGGNIRVAYEEYEFYGTRYARTINAAGNTSGATLSTTNFVNVPLYYVPAGN